MHKIKTQISKKFRFEAAHRLPFVPQGHKCGRIHGHSFCAKVTVEGDLDEKLGWVMDYADLKAVVAPFIELLDHNYLNEINGLENPTSENIAHWLLKKVAGELRAGQLVSVKISETCESSCTVYAS